MHSVCLSQKLEVMLASEPDLHAPFIEQEIATKCAPIVAMWERMIPLNLDFFGLYWFIIDKKATMLD